MHTLHCNYSCPDVKAPSHQYLQCTKTHIQVGPPHCNCCTSRHGRKIGRKFTWGFSITKEQLVYKINRCPCHYEIDMQIAPNLFSCRTRFSSFCSNYHTLEETKWSPHIADDIFNPILLCEKCCIVSLKLFPMCSINIIVQATDHYLNKLLLSLPTHIYATRPHWV